MIAQSQSGTGKTAAFVLAMLSRTDTSKNYPHVVCLSPTFELAIQTGEVAKKMAKFCPNIKIRHAVRGEERKYSKFDRPSLYKIWCYLIVLIIVPRGTQLTDHVLIGTPGKLLDWATKFRCFDLSKVQVFVLDEADVMIATQGHQDQSIRIHKYARSFSVCWESLLKIIISFDKIATQNVPDDVVLSHVWRRRHEVCRDDYQKPGRA